MRADVYLTQYGYVASRTRAGELIRTGHVLVDGRSVKKPAEELSDGEHVVTIEDPLRYVGRGGLKLEAALDAFQINVGGMRALDIGASTGGFTDCLLQRGAALVFAVDSGEGQLASALSENERVVSREHLNARILTTEHLDGRTVDLIVMDVSFISATYILPQFPALLSSNGCAICLIKPQFEVGRAMLGKGGIVRDRAARRYAIERVCECALSLGFRLGGLIPSPIRGGDGNLEYLLYLQSSDRETNALSLSELLQLVDSV